MGKGEENTENSDDEDTPQPEAKPETQETEEETEEKTAETEKPKEEEGETKKVDELRKVIKVDQKDGGEQPGDAEPDSRENLEQKRAILQSIKDFDFQIKKNQEEITGVNKKLDSVTKDLDDLVSLYEIVSEQMNPFVGLSKVTKKRIDALENFTKEIDDLKNRMGDIESFAVRAGADLKTISEQRVQGKTIENKTIEEKIEDKVEAEPEIKEEKKEETKVKAEETETETKEEISPEPEITQNEPEIPVQQTVPEEPIIKSEEIPSNNFNADPITYTTTKSYDYFDEIIEKSLRMMGFESQMDRVIDEFIESLKA